MRILEAFALHNLGMTEARLGLVDRGIEMQREAGRIADETGAARLRIHARVYEALLLLWRIGQARAEGHDIQESSDLAAAQALASFVEAEVRQLPALLPTARFVSAAVSYSRGEIGEALGLAQEAVELTHLTLIETLFAVDDDGGADSALEAAFSAICDRARKIARVEHRNAYLERIPEVARIVDLAKERLGKSLPFFNSLPLRPPPKG
jgi:hypothetical protein